MSRRKCCLYWSLVKHCFDEVAVGLDAVVLVPKVLGTVDLELLACITAVLMLVAHKDVLVGIQTSAVTM